ncbi:MAG: tetratricopeptide repeat protein [Candidatus Thorarchaeota archaeon]
MIRSIGINLGAVYLVINEYDKALNTFKHALKLKPHFDPIFTELFPGIKEKDFKLKFDKNGDKYL